MSQEGSDSDLAYVDEREDSYPEITRHSLPPEDSDGDQKQGEPLTDVGHKQSSSAGKKTGWVERKRPARKLLENRDAYRELFNSSIEEITGQHVQPYDRLLAPPSQIGASMWTSREKDVFFRKLPTLGRDNIKEIAAAIGSKSEFEVHQYIQLLNDGVVEGNLTQALDVNIAINIPAASEISLDCEATLEAAADVLAEDQRKWEKKRELKKHGDYWLLNEEVAEEIEEALSAAQGQRVISETQTTAEDVEAANADDGAEKIDLPIPAAELLDSMNWLEISRLFMWQSHEGSENWTDFITSRDETPSIYNTAFQDFHNLTVSLTRRLLQASIFQAQSRMRARDRDRGQNTKVYATDVQAAARVLDLKANSKKFWGTMPRRHGLKVYIREEKPKKKEQTTEEPTKGYRYGNLYQMSYDEVEVKLGVREEKDDLVDKGTLDALDDDSEIVDIYDDTDMWTEVSYTGDEDKMLDRVEGPSSDDEAPEDRTFQPEDNEREPQSYRQPSRHLDTKAIEKQLDTQAEALDRSSSAIEEARLWNLMGLAPPVEVKDEETGLIGALPAKRKTKSELRDWRRYIDYESEWERETGLASMEEFAAMEKRGAIGRKRRKLARDEPKGNPWRSSRSGMDNSHIYGSSDEEEDEELEPPRLPQPAEHIGVVWPMQSIESVEGVEPGESRWPAPATSDIPGSPESAEHVQPTDGMSYQMIASRRRKPGATASPSGLRRAASVRSQTPKVSIRRPSFHSQASESTGTAEAYLRALSHNKESSSRRVTPSNTSRRPSATDAESGAEPDVKMDASDAGSNSSSDIDTTRKPIRRAIRSPLSEPAGSGSGPDEDPEDEGWMATMERVKKVDIEVEQKQGRH